MRKRKLSKFLAIMLAMVMLAGMLPMMATANTTPFELVEGPGTRVGGFRLEENLVGVFTDDPTGLVSGSVLQSIMKIDEHGVQVDGEGARVNGDVVIFDPDSTAATEERQELFEAMQDGIPLYEFYAARTLNDTTLTFSNNIPGGAYGLTVFPVTWGQPRQPGVWNTVVDVAPHAVFSGSTATRANTRPTEDSIRFTNLRDRDTVVVNDGDGNFVIVRFILIAEITYRTVGARGNESATFRTANSPNLEHRGEVPITAQSSVAIRPSTMGPPDPRNQAGNWLEEQNPTTLRITVAGLTAGRQAVIRDHHDYRNVATGVSVNEASVRGIVSLAQNGYFELDLHHQVYDIRISFEYIDAGPLPAPEGFRFENRISGGIRNHAQVPNANRAIVWDPVPGAVEYIVYAFEDPNETNPDNAYRRQVVRGSTEIAIGHESVQMCRRHFQRAIEEATGTGHIFTGNNANNGAQGICPNDGPHLCPDYENGCAYCPEIGPGLSWSAMQASARQGFDLPLPYRQFHFRVVAVPANGTRNQNSDLSEAVAARPGARSVDRYQMAALRDDAVARGAMSCGFVFIEAGQASWNYAVGVYNRTFIQHNWATASQNNMFHVDGQDGIRGPSGLTNRNFVERVALEIEHHVAYIGDDTLIFTT